MKESGRAGRDGEAVQSVIMIEKREYMRLKMLPEAVFTKDNKAIHEFILTNGCRRMVISRYFNGENRGIGCEALNAQRCDNCRINGKESEYEKRREVEVMNERRKRIKTTM